MQAAQYAAEKKRGFATRNSHWALLPHAAPVAAVRVGTPRSVDRPSVAEHKVLSLQERALSLYGLAETQARRPARLFVCVGRMGK